MKNIFDFTFETVHYELLRVTKLIFNLAYYQHVYLNIRHTFLPRLRIHKLKFDIFVEYYIHVLMYSHSIILINVFLLWNLTDQRNLLCIPYFIRNQHLQRLHPCSLNRRWLRLKRSIVSTYQHTIVHLSIIVEFILSIGISNFWSINYLPFPFISLKRFQLILMFLRFQSSIERCINQRFVSDIL